MQSSVCANSHSIVIILWSMLFVVLDTVSDIKSCLVLQEDGELEIEEEPEPAPYAKTLTLERPW